jgi:hypothetical protein
MNPTLYGFQKSGIRPDARPLIPLIFLYYSAKLQKDLA